MIKSGTRYYKKSGKNEYLYYMYYGKNGNRISKYCGRVGDVQTELNALQHEYDVRSDAGIENDKRLKEIKTTMKQLSKKL